MSSAANNNSGKLDSEAFKKCALELVQKSELLFDDWQIKRDESSDEIYLVKTALSTTTGLKFEYHVIYSVAYSVPVLYFRMFQRDTGEIVWHSNELPIAKQESGGSLTQMPHPYEQTPFLQLHPCYTANWMAEMQNLAPQANYLVSWLSFIGPHVGMLVSEKYI